MSDYPIYVKISSPDGWVRYPGNDVEDVIRRLEGYLERATKPGVELKFDITAPDLQTKDRIRMRLKAIQEQEP